MMTRKKLSCILYHVEYHEVIFICACVQTGGKGWIVQLSLAMQSTVAWVIFQGKLPFLLVQEWPEAECHF